jgi:hypothetical protein
MYLKSIKHFEVIIFIYIIWKKHVILEIDKILDFSKNLKWSKLK